MPVKLDVHHADLGGRPRRLGQGQLRHGLLPMAEGRPLSVAVVILDFPKVGGTPGRPRELPDNAYADRGYDSEPLRTLLRWLGIEPHIAKRRTPHGSGLGKVRWVVERTISWLKGLRRLRVRYDRLGVIMDAWATLAA